MMSNYLVWPFVCGLSAVCCALYVGYWLGAEPGLAAFFLLAYGIALVEFAKGK